MGVATGCGCKEVYNIDFLILIIPTPLVIVLFYSSILTFCSFLKCFSFLFQYSFVIKFYVLNIFSRSINTHMGNYGRPTAAIIMKVAHNVLFLFILRAIIKFCCINTIQ